MSQLEHDRTPDWRGRLDRGLVRRLVRRRARPGVVDRSWTGPLLARGSVGRRALPLLESWGRRWGRAEAASEALPPIVYAEPAAPETALAARRAASSARIVRAKRVTGRATDQSPEGAPGPELPVVRAHPAGGRSAPESGPARTVRRKKPPLPGARRAAAAGSPETPSRDAESGRPRAELPQAAGAARSPVGHPEPGADRPEVSKRLNGSPVERAAPPGLRPGESEDGDPAGALARAPVVDARPVVQAGGRHPAPGHHPLPVGGRSLPGPGGEAAGALAAGPARGRTTGPFAERPTPGAARSKSRGGRPGRLARKSSQMATGPESLEPAQPKTADRPVARARRKAAALVVRPLPAVGAAGGRPPDSETPLGGANGSSAPVFRAAAPRGPAPRSIRTLPVVPVERSSASEGPARRGPAASSSQGSGRPPSAIDASPAARLPLPRFQAPLPESKSGPPAPPPAPRGAGAQVVQRMPTAGASGREGAGTAAPTAARKRRRRDEEREAEELAERAVDRLLRRLAVERERRGWTRWV